MAYRKVPKKTVILGDVAKGKQYIGQADSQLNILQNQMRFQKIQQAWRTVRLAKDVVVECFSGFNLSEVRIHAAPLPTGKSALSETRRCFCDCCAAIGKIVSARDVEDEGWLPNRGLDYFYDVEICQKSKYTLLEDLTVSADHFIHLEGDIVLLIAKPHDEDEDLDIEFEDIEEICEWLNWRITSINPSIAVRAWTS